MSFIEKKHTTKSAIRRYLLPYLIAAATLSANESAKPIPPDRHEAISRAMIRVQSAQLAAIEAEKRAEAARADYERLLEDLRKEFGAPGCALTIDKQWQCPKELK